MNDMRGSLVDKISETDVADESAAANDDEMIGRDRHLAHQVPGEEHRARLGCEALQEVSAPPDPFGIQPVDGLVEDERLGIPQQGEAIPNRWPIPRENWPARWRATSSRPTSEINSCTRERGIPCVWARVSRW